MWCLLAISPGFTCTFGNRWTSLESSLSGTAVRWSHVLLLGVSGTALALRPSSAAGRGRFPQAGPHLSPVVPVTC